MSRKVLLFVLLSVLAETSQAQADREKWVDSVFATLNRQAKVAQLLLVPIPSNPSKDDINDLEDLARDGIGGIYLTHGGPVRHAAVINKLQRASSRRLLVGASAEWGLDQSLDSVQHLPKPMVAGALPSDSLVALWAKSIARQMKELNIHINFAPNADDQVFAGDYLRYFGDQAEQVGRTSSTFVRALQEEGVMAVAKHLPRRWGDERPLPDSMVVLQLDRIDTSTLQPFQQLIRAHIAGISTDYVHFSIQNEAGIVPASVSQAFVTEVLRKRLGFEGLVFSDAGSIRRRLGKVRAGDAELLAFQAGADMIYNPVDASAGIKKISREVRKNKLLMTQLDASVKKILAAKYDAGLAGYHPINTDNLYRRLNAPEYRRVNSIIASAAITVVHQQDSILPVKLIENTSFVSLSIGNEAGAEFDQVLSRYASFRNFSVRQPQDTAGVSVTPGDILVIGIYPHAGALEYRLKSWLQRMTTNGRAIVVHFGHPASLALYAGAGALIAAYTDKDGMPAAAAGIIFGGIPATGQLPVAAGEWRSGTSVQTSNLGRLSYAVPEAVGISSTSLEKIRSIMEDAVATKGTPGCYALIAKDGKVIYEESAGWLTYEKQQPVNESTIYDLASMTKVLALTPTIMFLHEKGIIDINKKASVYLPELKATNKADLTIIDILTHQAGLQPFIPVWPKTMLSKDEHDPYYYSRERSQAYSYQVAPNLFGALHLKDSSWKWMLETELLQKPPRTPYPFRYSDLGPWILYQMAERLLNQPMDAFLQQNFYDPLGAGTTGFLPLDRFDPSRIAPTEVDTIFRKELVAGTVHDERAAVLGGVAGHAGLFSNATDVAKFGQMLLQKGYYGGYQYFKPETVELFTRKQFKPNRRGLGWDKPIQSEWSSPTALLASPETFGHTGFTGTCIWIDPEFNLVFVFLSNRVHPGRNSSFNSANVRTRIQEVIYRSMFTYCAGN